MLLCPFAACKRAACKGRVGVLCSLRRVRFCCSQWFPFVNLIYDFLYDKEPSVGAVKDIMNAQGLVCALLLGVVMAMPSSVTFEELTAANLRYVEMPALHDFYHMSRDLPLDPVLAVKYGPNTFSNRLVYMIAGASGALTSGLLSIVREAGELLPIPPRADATRCRAPLHRC